MLWLENNILSNSQLVNYHRYKKYVIWTHIFIYQISFKIQYWESNLEIALNEGTFKHTIQPLTLYCAFYNYVLTYICGKISIKLTWYWNWRKTFPLCKCCVLEKINRSLQGKSSILRNVDFVKLKEPWFVASTSLKCNIIWDNLTSSITRYLKECQNII